VVGCNIGAPDGQTLHLLRCDTETGAMSLVQTVKGVQGTNYFCLDKDSTADNLVFNRTVALKDSFKK
jgi:hypothetical protein